MEIFDDKRFEKYRDFIYKKFGINFPDTKKTLLESKIKKAMFRKEEESFDVFFETINKRENASILEEFINIVTTNTTEFFRENQHFEYISKNIDNILKINPRIQANKEIRIWCSASSTGQEPITIAITFKECLSKDINIKILATDISSKVLGKAINGIYTGNECKDIPNNYLEKYFDLQNDGFYKVKKEISELISYRQFNLMDNFDFKKGFDIIFCRNVMIYFDRNTQQKLIDKFYENLLPGGYIFIGHSESLINKTHKFLSNGPSIYYK